MSKKDIMIQIFTELEHIHFIIPIQGSPVGFGEARLGCLSHQDTKLTTYLTLMDNYQANIRRKVNSQGGISRRELNALWETYTECQVRKESVRRLLWKIVDAKFPPEKWFRNELRDKFQIVRVWNGPFSLN